MEKIKITKLGETVGKLGKSPKEKQSMINIGDSYHIWNTLTNRYDAINITNIMISLVKNNDLKIVVNDGLEVLNFEVNKLETIMKEYAIPMPEKPPEKANITMDLNAITDKAIYRYIKAGIKEAIVMLAEYYTEAQKSTFRELFYLLMKKEMELYDRFYEYGKLKGYLNEVPIFRV